MIETLHDAGRQLRTALDRYLRICSTIQSACLDGTPPCNIPSEYTQQIDQELELMGSYELDMAQAKLALRSTHNHAVRTAPINSLPPEILTHIFHMARDDDFVCVDHVAAVCSRWRSVALSTPSLWTYIVYCPNGSDWRFEELLVRAQLHAARSGPLLLDVYISGLSELYAQLNYYSELISFCQTIAPRMQSLELDFEDFHNITWSDDHEHSVLTALLSHCKAGVLAKLVTVDPGRFSFLMTGENSHLADSFLKVGVKYLDLEKLLAPVKVLHLTGLFPHWTSDAYSGLVDLRLSPAHGGQYHSVDGGSISESRLVDILSASPQLRILHFNLQFVNPQEDDVTMAHRRANLAELEVLRVDPGYADDTFDEIENTLKLLEPGTKPLAIALINRDPSRDCGISAIETKGFFARSIVTKLYATGIPRLFELLPALTRLKVLVLSEQTHGLRSLPPSSSYHHGDDLQAVYPLLDVCFLLNCRLELDEVYLLVQKCRPRTLVLYENIFEQDGYNAKIEVVEKELSSICPDVIVADEYPSLAAHQELLEDY